MNTISKSFTLTNNILLDGHTIEEFRAVSAECENYSTMDDDTYPDADLFEVLQDAYEEVPEAFTDDEVEE